jgi:hypothetical protein
MAVGANSVASLAERQRWQCIWCEFQMAKDADEAFALAGREYPADARPSLSSMTKASRHRFAKGISATFDHVVPKADGGTDAQSNGLAACRWCNNWRGTESPETFKERVTALVHRGAHPRQIFRRTGTWPSGMPLKGAIGNGGSWRSEPAI